jgi:putative Mn2+ efflux pump MntP
MLVDKIFIFGLALSFDAFGVALGIGCGKRLNLKETASIIFSFAFFQYLFAFLGGIVGNLINSNLFNISGFFSGAVIILLGILLLKEGYENDEDCVYYDLDFWKYIVLGISVSIDALGVGFSVLFKYPISTLIINSIIIGIITLVVTLFSLKIVKFIRNFTLVEKYSAYMGGLILIIFGLKMLL